MHPVEFEVTDISSNRHWRTKYGYKFGDGIATDPRNRNVLLGLQRIF